MRFIKKGLLFCLIIVLLVVPIQRNRGNIFASTEYLSLNVEITPPNAGARAAYHIYGSISDYDDINALEIIFKKSTIFELKEIPLNAVLVNEKHPLSVSYSDFESYKKIKINLGNKIQSGEKIDIYFSEDAGIKNPVVPARCYVLVVKLIHNSITLDSIVSNKYTICHSKVSTPIVTVDPSIQGMNAEYTIRFTTGVNGFLYAHVDGILIKFPDGTKLPTNLFSKYILIKTGEETTYHTISSVYGVADGPGGSGIRFFAPIDIKPYSDVVVLIKKEFGLINTKTPSTGGEYIYVSDRQEPDWVESTPFNIAPPMVQNFTISLGSDIITMNSSIHIGFTTSPIGSLIKGENIYINFPDGFTLPELIGASFVSVNGKNADTEVNGKQVIIHVPENIGNNDDVVIEISDGAHLANPMYFGDYEIEVYTDNDSYAAAVTVSITRSSVKNVVLDALYSGMGVKNEFNVIFTTGPAGELTSGVDYVKVNFGNAFEFPESASEETIFINDIPVSNVSIDVYSVIATVPLNIEPNSEVKVKIPVDFGIRNPEGIGDYALKISTSKETAEIESNILIITVLPVVEFTVTPSSPDGENGFYKNKPNVQLSSSNGEEIYFKMDDGEFLLYDGQSIVIQEGERKLFAYAVDKIGNKGDVEERNFKVDSMPPTVSFDQGSGDIYVNKIHTVLTGKVSEPCVLQINGIPATVGSDLSFHVELDVMDKFPLAIYARDIASNSVSIMRTVYLDEELPVITTLSPDEEQYSTAEETIEIRLKLNEEGTVILNGKAMDFDGNIFSMTVNLYNGENNFSIIAADLAGNKTTKNITISRVNEIVITLQIGSDIAYVGSEMKTLDTAPIIQNGRTLVPLRFISEALGAVVDWNGDLQLIMITHKTHTIQLQIGSSIARIDSSNVKTLDTPPIIQNERTLVPLRFIMETFGATVDWENETKTITIIYTP